MNVKDIPIPERLASLPRDPRGYPIFFTIQQPEMGAYSFLAMQWGQVVRCARERLCGLCGQPLTYWIYFAGGPLSCANRTFGDPPMHRDCVNYARAVCPFMIAPNYRRVEERSDRPADTIHSETGAHSDNPQYGIYRTRRYEWYMERNGTIIFRPAPAVEVEWFERGKGDPS